MLQRAETTAANVPLADHGRDVAGFLKVIGQHLFVQRHLHFDLRVQHLLRNTVGPPGQIGRQVQTCRCFAGEDGGAGGRADWLSAIG